MESEHFKMNESRLKKESPLTGKLNDLKLSEGIIQNLDDKMLARNQLADGEVDKRLKKADKF